MAKSHRRAPSAPVASSAAPQRPAGFDWRRIAYHALCSRALDDIEEGTNRNRTSVPKEHVVLYQFSSRGHDVAQCILGSLLTGQHDGIGALVHSGGDVGDFGAGRHRAGDHRLQHLGRDHHRLAVLPAGAHDALLQHRHLLRPQVGKGIFLHQAPQHGLLAQQVCGQHRAAPLEQVWRQGTQAGGAQLRQGVGLGLPVPRQREGLAPGIDQAHGCRGPGVQHRDGRGHRPEQAMVTHIGPVHPCDRYLTTTRAEGPFAPHAQ